MWPFKKKEEEPDPDSVKDEPEEEPQPKEAEPSVDLTAGGGDIGIQVTKMGAEVEKLKAQFSTFFEVQKAGNERFSNISSQIGELRTMMIERDKEGQRLEAKALQAVDMVKTVQPDKFLVDLRKMDSKIEALKANIEGNETVLKNNMSELKAMRDKMIVFKGMEQVIKMNEEVKGELMEIKKVQSIIERHADKVETIFAEMQKKTKEFVRFNDTVQDLDKGFKQVASEFDTIKVKITDFSTKKEMENLVAKFDDFEKYVGSIISLVTSKFEKLEIKFTEDFNKKFEHTEKLLMGFETLAQKTPDLDKYFNLLSEEAKAKIEEDKKKQEEEGGGPVEKLKQPGEEEKIKVEPKETIMSKVSDAVSDAASNVKEKVAGK